MQPSLAVIGGQRLLSLAAWRPCFGCTFFRAKVCTFLSWGYGLLLQGGRCVLTLPVLAMTLTALALRVSAGPCRLRLAVLIDGYAALVFLIFSGARSASVKASIFSFSSVAFSSASVA